MIRNWKVKKLGEVCEIGAGNSAPQKKELFDGGDYPFIRTSDVGKIRFGTINNSADKLNDRGIKKLRLCRKGTLLFPKSGASTFLNHRVLLEVDGYVSSHLATLKAKENLLEDRFLLYFSATIDSRDLMQDQNYPSLRLSDIKNIDILIPPLPEQKRIVTILDEAFAGIDKAKQNAEKNLANARELFESYLNDLFSNAGDSWENKRFGNLCQFIRGPFGGSLKKSCFQPSGIAVYEQQHAIYDQFENIRYFINETKYNEMKRFEVFPGDLIMSCSGTMGKVAIVPETVKKGIINQALLKLTPNNEIEALYLKIWMESNHFIDQLSKHTKGAAIKNVASVKVLKEIYVPVPSLKKQKEIIDEIRQFSDETQKLSDTYKQKLADLEELKKSILQKAFSGELKG